MLWNKRPFVDGMKSRGDLWSNGYSSAFTLKYNNSGAYEHARILHKHEDNTSAQ